VTIFFCMAVFFTQITMLNMLIAIMGDSFAQAIESKDKLAIRTKIDILSSQAPALNTAATFDETKVFMIRVTVREDEDESNSDWIGTV